MAAKGQVEAASARAHKALDLRIAGASYRHIGRRLDVSYQTAFRDVQAALAELDALTKERAERLRELELNRCDKLTLAFWPKVTTGDAKAARVVLGVMKRRAKLLGLDAPTKIAPTNPGGDESYTPIDVSKLSTETIDTILAELADK